jgi:hypothetical protein
VDRVSFNAENESFHKKGYLTEPDNMIDEMRNSILKIRIKLCSEVVEHQATI